MKKFIPVIVFAISCACGFSQTPDSIPGVDQNKSDTLRKDALKIYMDASDYIKKEIPYVNYVRDIKDAGVYIISTTEGTGSGGTKYSYYLVGQNEFSGMRDTLVYYSSPDDTQESRRIMQVKTLKVGLMRYVAKTPLSKYINISFSEPLSETVSDDKWKSWVYRASLSGSGQGQKTYTSYSLNGSVSARKVTQDWKIDIDASYYHQKQTFEINDSTDYASIYDSKEVEGLVVRSINDHWSYGGSARIGSSTYSNYKLNTNLMPGIEYDFYPYSQSTRKQLRLLYKIGPTFSIYNDTTIYEKTSEFLWQHSITAAYQVIEKWGTINISLLYSNYLHDWSENNLGSDVYLDLRIAKGLQLYVGGGASIIHDQVNLPKGGATPQEVLLRRKELATQFEFYVSFGFSYTFGSIYNNVVNPRFGGSGGGYVIYY
jgi:hypothetical protein